MVFLTDGNEMSCIFRKLSFTFALYFTLVSIFFPENVRSTDYCKVKCSSGTHTMCLYPSSKPEDPCERKLMKVADKKHILDLHNQFRSDVAMGSKKPQPSASNMLQLRWDKELTEIAARWVIQCQMGHDKCRDTTRFKVGQNLAYRSDWDLDKMVTSWFDEIKDYPPDAVDKVQFNQNTGHYTQAVWAKTYTIGCAATDAGSSASFRYTLGCNYGPAGNMLGEPVYQKGQPQSSCPKDPDTKASSKYSGLCALTAPEEPIEDDREESGSTKLKSMPLLLMIMLSGSLIVDDWHALLVLMLLGIIL